LLLIERGLPQLVLIAIPFASLVELMIASWFMSRDKVIPSDEKVGGFDWRYFYSSIITGLSSISFLALDVILAKHFLNPTDAGEYALLSFIGKITYFLTSLVSPFILPLIANRHGANKSTKETFFVLFGMTLLITIGSFVGLGLFGSLFVPVLFGTNGASIVEFLPLYVLTVALFSVTTPIVTYFLAKDEYLYVSAGLVVAFSQLILTSIFHENLTQFVIVMFVVSLLNLVSIFIVFILKTHYPIALKNVQDFVSLLFPTENFGSRTTNLESKRILIFNWRDTSHVWAGGAETYIHELAKRWVKEGHRVTVFCGNDGKNPRNEVIDGVQMVRRGGFYTVYIWAVLYYVLRFRGLFDVVIDSENGIPFFSPLFVRVPTFLLIHHIHQDVFRKHLRFPMSWLAIFLEAKLMPLVYKNQQIITVSESSKLEILKLGLGSEESIEVIYPGIDPSQFKHSKKTSYPSFLYLGRLQPYKNIDIAIKAFKKVVEKYPAARLTIAGFGEMSFDLKTLAEKLNIAEYVHFTGKVSQSEKSQLMAEHWVFIQPSMLEGWGITVIEANASATPVIASNVNGLKDSVVDQKTGILVKPKDVNAFSEAMIILIANKKTRDQYTKQSLEWAKQFDWKNSAAKFSKSMHRVLEERILLKSKFVFIKSS
jgi:glycosyltransferase involved in cell wall biosynthesis